MKKTIIEVLSILAVSFMAALIFNQASENRIHIFQNFEKVEPVDQEYNVETIDIEVLRYYLGRDGTIVLDARSAEEFKSGHIPGSSNFSIHEFDSLFRERGELLKLGNTIIVYCSGPDCEDSHILVAKLSEKGINDIFLFKGGIEEWIGSGYEITEKIIH
jgi:rhodanese-related sulfurtransferase